MGSVTTVFTVGGGNYGVVVVTESVLALFVTYGAVTVIGTCGSYPIVAESFDRSLSLSLAVLTTSTISTADYAGFGTGGIFVCYLAIDVVTESVNGNVNAVELCIANGTVNNVVVRAVVFTIGSNIVLNLSCTGSVTELLSVGINVSVVTS